MTNLLSASSLLEMKGTVMSRICDEFSGHGSSTAKRLVLIVLLALFVHVMVKVIRQISEWITRKSGARKHPFGFVTQQPKVISLLQLIFNGLTFIVYFFAIGLILQEFGVNLMAYLASASIIGLAISFGSQGLVQDMVIGLTLICSDTMDVGDMVEIVGTTVVVGRVEVIGLRFTKLLNFYNQEVFIPNRTIANVSRFPHDGIDAYADVEIPVGAAQREAVEIVECIAQGMRMQFGDIILADPTIGKVEKTTGCASMFLRVHFIIWAGQGSLIETTFRQRVINAMKAFDPKYADWQVPVTYRAGVVYGNAPQNMDTSPGKSAN
jgi:small conductance mechanosensitive channel